MKFSLVTNIFLASAIFSWWAPESYLGMLGIEDDSLEEEFQTLRVDHTNGQQSIVRVKNPSGLGIDADVKQLSGYVDFPESDKHLFFWLFESRNDPANDPVVMWLNGGPGCSSSAAGLFFELGPAKVAEDLNVYDNPHSWNSNATLFFLDQPVNTGYSYSESQHVNTSAEAAEDVYRFLTTLFAAFPEYNSNQAFHIAGESYCGHYIPAIANRIVEAGDSAIFDLESVLIGNGITDVLLQTEAQVAMACGHGGFPPVLSLDTCEDLYRALPKCQLVMQECYDTQSDLLCTLARDYCEGLSRPYGETGRNPFQIDDICWDDCYPEQNWITAYLNQTSVKNAIGAKTSLDYQDCSSDVGHDFRLTLDRVHSYADQLRNVLENDVNVLLYAGDLDYRVNWMGISALSERLVWSGHDEFVSTPITPWLFDGEPAGYGRQSGTLAFRRIFNAGHMVPYNQPEVALAMFNEWLHGM